MRRVAAVPDESGLAMTLFAITLVAMVVFVALVIDLGNARQSRSSLQAATDAGALAAANTIGGQTGANMGADYAARNLSANGTATYQSITGSIYYYTSSAGDDIYVTTPYQGNSAKINVKVCRSVP